MKKHLYDPCCQLGAQKKENTGGRFGKTAAKT